MLFASRNKLKRAAQVDLEGWKRTVSCAELLYFYSKKVQHEGI